MRKFIIIAILFMSLIEVISSEEDIESIYLKIQDSFRNNNFSNLERFFPADRKIYFFIPQLIDKNRYFTAQQLHFILKDMESNITTQEFIFEKRAENSGKNSLRKARWKFKKEGELFSITLFFNLAYINDEWKIIEIKIS